MMHVTEVLLDAYHRGKLSAELLIEIQHAHFVATCGACSEGIAAHEAGVRHGQGGRPAAVRDPIARLGRRLGWGERQLREEVGIARRQVREIVRLGPAERRRKIQGAHSRYQGPLFGSLLLAEARSKMPAEPAEALALAEAALLSASRRTRRHEPDPEVQAAALAVGGNARRALGRLREAEADLEKALRLLHDPRLRDQILPAELYSYLGSLRKDQSRLHEAARHLLLSRILYDALDEAGNAARVLLTLAGVHFRAHDFDAAVEAAEDAAGLLPTDTESWLRAYARYNLAYYLHARGSLDRAEAELESHADLLAEAGDRVVHHVVWLRARIAWSRGDVRTAERLYAQAHDGMVELGFPFETSLICLELAVVCLVQGRTARVKALAAEAVQRLSGEEEVDRETRAALALAEEAARREAVTRELLEQTIAAVERARLAGS